MKTVLLAVVGRSPQIVTETLYYLTQVQKKSIQEIVVLTTEVGSKEFNQKLLANGKGYFFRFCQDYGFNYTDFGLKNPILLEGKDGSPLSDIRTSEENELAANKILQTVRELTSPPDTQLLCSIAGGRKTMSVYVSFAMQFFGRPHDKLYHVLVWPPDMEGMSDFFYPPVDAGKLTFRGHDRELTIDSRDIHVDLAEIPFIQLRDIIGEAINFDLPFSQLVHLAQEAIRVRQLPEMVLIPREKKLILKFFEGQAATVRMAPKQIAVLAYLMEQSEPIWINDFDLTRISQIYAHYFPRREYAFKPVAQHIKNMEYKDIHEQLSRIRKRIRNEITKIYGMEKFAEPFLPKTVGPKDDHIYIPVPRDKRKIQSFPPEITTL